MAIFADKKNYAGMANPFWLEPSSKDVMGYRITGMVAGDVIPQGTPLQADEDAKTAVVCKYAYVLDVANDKKTLTVKAGHFLKASDKVAISNGGTLTQLTIASVTKDTIVLSAQNNNIKKGDVLVEVKTEDSVVKPVAVPNRIVADRVKLDALDQTVNAVHSGAVIQNVLQFPVEYLNKTAFPGTTLLVGCPLIIFIKQ